MTINGSYPSTVLSNLDPAGAQSGDAGIALLKKAQDQAKVQAEGLLRGLVESTPANCPTGCGQHLDAYA